MIKELAKLATRLDRLGLTKEADVLDAALNKLAQAQVATTGDPGVEYKDTSGMETGYTPGGPAQKFYKAAPTSISELNRNLGAIIKNVGSPTFSDKVIKNPPSAADTSWGPKTQAAFKEYAIAAGYPKAGDDWQAFAKESGYTPSILGVYRFWVDTIHRVDREGYLTRTLEKHSPPVSEAPAATGTSGATGTQKGTLPAATQIRLEQIQDTARRIVEERS